MNIAAKFPSSDFPVFDCAIYIIGVNLIISCCRVQDW